MNHFFLTPENIYNGEAFISGQDVNHIKNVLRMKVGDELLISDGQGMDRVCVIKSISDNEVTCTITEETESVTETRSRFYLFQGLPKADKFELIIQKAVELGVYEIIPVQMARSIVKYDDKKAASKIERWQKIAEGAAKQSRRGIIPEVKPVMSFKEAVKYAGSLDINVIPYENFPDMKSTKEVIDEVKPGMSVGIFVGPEGGLEESEVETANASGIKSISLGKRILRTETAPLMILSVLMYNDETADI